MDSEIRFYLLSRGAMPFGEFERSQPVANLRAKLLERGIDGKLPCLLRRYCFDSVELCIRGNGERWVQLPQRRSPSPERALSCAQLPPIRAFGVEIGPQVL